MTTDNSSTHHGLILMREHEDSAHGLILRFWVKAREGGQVNRIEISPADSVCFVPQANLPMLQPLLAHGCRVGERVFLTAGQVAMVPIYTPGWQAQRRWVRRALAAGIAVEEDDILPADRYLMERFITSGVAVHPARSPAANVQLRPAEVEPELHAVSLDIETSRFRPGETPALYSIALHSTRVSRVYVAWDTVPEALAHHPEAEWIACGSGQGVLARLLADWEALEADVILGWHVVGFDLQVLASLAEQWGLAFTLGREHRPVSWRVQGNRRLISVPGRMVVDGIEALRSAGYQFDSFSLEHVAQQLMGTGKSLTAKDTAKTDTIDRWFAEQNPELLHYNLLDAGLVSDLFQQEKLLPFLLARARLTGHSLDRVGGSAAAFNHLYLPRLHRKGYVAPHVGSQTLRTTSPGGYVMDSQPGLYRQVLVLDFKSLYPSIMRTFQVDPWALWEALKAPEKDTVPGYLDGRFLRQGAILPGLLDQLWHARDAAKAAQDQPLNQAIKILMNSFYGVLGSDVCRFFDPRLASSITRRGHAIMKASQAWLEARNLPVIYGDTDSLFVWVRSNEGDPMALGHRLAAELTAWWADQLRRDYDLDSFLELEFETCYHRFHMPTIRGTEQGSKKRYVGLVTDVDGSERLVFKGMEAVRSDWTPLAQRFQHELYHALFHDEPLEPLIQRVRGDLFAGLLDDDLWYRKRLRRPVAEYEHSNPPHVKAARRQESLTGEPVRGWISYRLGRQGILVAADGEQPLDYEHYADKQLAPVADAVLHLLGTNFHQLASQQLPLL